MSFLLITGTIMATSIYLIEKLCHFAGIELKRSSLILCAIMAFVVNALAIALSPFLTHAHYVRLFGLVVLAAGIVTLFNERLLRHDEAKQAQAATHQPEPAEAPLPEKEKAAPAESVPAEKKAAHVPENPIEKAAEKSMGTPPQKPVPEKAPAKIPAPGKERALPHKPLIVGAKGSAAETAAQDIQVLPQLPAAKPQPEEKPAPQQPVTIPAPAAAAAAAISAMDSLDALLDYILQSDDVPSKVYAAQLAIDRYEGDSYAPFLMIELANLYKDNAAYESAIAVYEQALQKPIIADNAAMAGKFQETLLYLRTVLSILKRHQATAMKFPDIPDAWMQEIEAADEQAEQAEKHHPDLGEEKHEEK